MLHHTRILLTRLLLRASGAHALGRFVGLEEFRDACLLGVLIGDAQVDALEYLSEDARPSRILSRPAAKEILHVPAMLRVAVAFGHVRQERPCIGGKLGNQAIPVLYIRGPAESSSRVARVRGAHSSKIRRGGYAPPA